MAANFIVANSRKPKVRIEGWKKPRRDSVKLNVDASFDQDSLQGSVGAVITDLNGKIIAAAHEKLEICYDAFTTEAIAVSTQTRIFILGGQRNLR
ncbi:Laccase-4 [Hordeum vulgare]|nr:Laccase-4 [Hordeum vulgare]